MSTQATQMTRTAAQIRQAFIDFFVEKHGHTSWASSPVVPRDDPTLLFTNAGMNQFKPIFLGQVAPGSAFEALRRAVNSQKCIRAGGKHNDLEDVGKDHYHQTFFEMLGNWSFGDYFKAEAIEWAWDLLTSPEHFGLDKDRLHVTVFEGNEAEGLPPDEEAGKLWRRLLPAERISRWSKKDNFWEMGPSGPCGPCSEIHYDFTEDLSGGPLVNAGDPRVVELWNLVFIQFNRTEAGSLEPLPARHVDTGMGLERLTRVLQHVESNYATDLFTPIIAAIRQRSGARAYRGTLEDPVDIAYRVIADHIRCLTVALTDGAWPSNEGRGFVLRRILRRAVRHAHQTLRVDGPILCELVPAVVGSLGDAFPDLKARPQRIADMIRDEEESFLKTLDRGIALFGAALERAGAGTLTAQDAFKLHDTYGFPIDLTRVMAAERGLKVDEAGYQKLMEAARRRSRKAAAGGAEITLPPEATARLKHLDVGPTDEKAKYHPRPITARVEAIWNGRDFDEHAHTGRRVAVILNRTNHYTEAGGQVGDHGEIRTGMREGRPDAVFAVEDTQAAGGYVLHLGHVTEHELRVGDHVTVTVEQKRRTPILANHTATHLLNFALREVIGPEEDQKGSLVAPDRLRFDFACSHAMSAEQIERAEAMVNQAIEGKLAVHAAVIPLERALAITGIRAVFGEKYPDPVRVVAIGVPVEEVSADPANERWRDHSIELCGGTHLGQTHDALRFVIVQEQALAAGIRRITAVTGPAALAAEEAGRNLEARLEQAAGLSGPELVEQVKEISCLLDDFTLRSVARGELTARLDELRAKAREVAQSRKAASQAGIVERARQVAATAQGPVIVEGFETADRDELMAAMDAIRARHAECAVMVFGRDVAQKKVAIVARVPDALIKLGLKAGDWVREAAGACGGSGGGRPDMAQAGGNHPKKVPEAITAARAFAEKTLS